MALTVTMPQLGESVTEGTIARWLKQPGDAIAKYESIAEVITDKVNAEIPAPADGVMSELIAPEGAVVPVGQPICSIDTAGAAASDGRGGPATSGAGRQPPAPAAPHACRLRPRRSRSGARGERRRRAVAAHRPLPAEAVGRLRRRPRSLRFRPRSPNRRRGSVASVRRQAAGGSGQGAVGIT